jgi:DNA-binding NarL/FixJ family response regulator
MKRDTEQQIQVLIVDDHPLFRSGLEKALGMETDIEVVGFCETGEEVLSKVDALSPDVVLLDVNLPRMNGLQVARMLKSSQVDVAIIILTAHHDEEQVIHALKSGAAAYCAKDVHPETLVKYIRYVARGRFVVNENIVLDARQFEDWMTQRIEELSASAYYTDAEGHFIPLSQREMEILEYVTKGLINKEIAHKLGISQQTVKNHMTSILKKLNVNDRTQAAVMALRRGWVRLNGDSESEA